MAESTSASPNDRDPILDYTNWADWSEYWRGHLDIFDLWRYTDPAAADDLPPPTSSINREIIKQAAGQSPIAHSNPGTHLNPGTQSNPPSIPPMQQLPWYGPPQANHAWTSQPQPPAPQGFDNQGSDNHAHLLLARASYISD